MSCDIKVMVWCVITVLAYMWECMITYKVSETTHLACIGAVDRFMAPPPSVEFKTHDTSKQY